ncbi:MAG: tandem-95 repeat protein, partial [Thalassolituus sp.]
MKSQILSGLFAVALSQAASATIVIVNNDSAGEGFNDPTPVLAVGGNSGMTLGNQRLNVFNKAAEILNETFQIDTIVKVGSSFDPLTCSTYYATLGQAGPAAVEFDYGTHSITPHALHNQLVGYDSDTGQVEITAQFNSSIDNNDSCLIGTNWYYGYDAPSGYDNSLLSVVLHEIMHGMGFLSYLQYTGESGAGWNTIYGFEEGFDPYTRKLKDASSGQLLTNQAPSTRYSVMRSGNQLVWNGTEANAQSGNYSSGTNAGQIQMYAPASYTSGSSVSHFDTAMTPNDLMEPQYTEFLNTAGLAEQLLVDIGWNYNSASLPNSPPFLSAIGNRSLSEDGTLNVSLGASDSDGDALTFSLVSSSAALNASVTGSTLSINPIANFNGSGTLTVQVSDGTNTDSETITVTVTPVNDAPVFTSTGTQSVNEDSSATVNLSASDVDGDSLTYSITSATAALGASISGSVVSLNPTANFTGSGSVTVQVSDGSLTDTDTFTVNVINQNDAPVLTAIGNQSMNEDTTLNVSLSATDVDGDS